MVRAELCLLLLAGCVFSPPESLLTVESEVPPEGPLSTIIDDVLIRRANDYARAVAALPDGGFVVAVVSSSVTVVDSVVVRLSPAGAIESVSNVSTDANDYLETVLVDEEGAVYAAGSRVVSDTEASITVLKLAGDQIDPSFDVRLDFPGPCAPKSTYRVAFGMRFDPEGRLLVSGNATEADCVSRDMFLARLDRSGALDPKFGQDGVVLARADSATARSDNGQDVLALPDGRIAVVGNTNDTYDFDTARAVLWLHDTTGTEERVQLFSDLDRSGAGSDTFRAVTSDAEGRVLAAGRSFDGAGYDAVAVRFDAAGELDPTFANQGVFVSDAPGDDRARRIAVDAEGRIYLAGYLHNGSDEDVAIWRLAPDGTLDPAWGAQGVMTLDRGSDERAEGIAFDLLSRPIVAASVRQSDGTFAVWIVRLE